MFTAVTGAQLPLRRVQLSFHHVDRAMPFMADHLRRGACPVRDRRALARRRTRLDAATTRCTGSSRRERKRCPGPQPAK